MRLLVKFGVLLFSAGLYPGYDAQCRTISGTITGRGRGLEFAVVTVAGTEIGSTASKNGRFMIDVGDRNTVDLVFYMIGFTTKVQKVHPLAENTVLHVELAAEEGALGEVVVSGVSKATLIKENPQAVETVSKKQIEESAGDNVIDAIAHVTAGCQSVKTGPNISKPFINGLGYNRVLTLYDGMRVETQQWGDEHGVPLDDYLVERAEVIEGPASLMFGSDAIAGVLSLFAAMPADSLFGLHTRVLSEYQSNNGLIGNSVRLSHGGKKISWLLSGSERIAKNYSDPVDGRVYNTGFAMWCGSGHLGYRGKNGYSRLNLSLYDNRQSIPDGSRDSLTREFTYQIYESPGVNALLPKADDIKNRPKASDAMLNSYAPGSLGQRIQDLRLYLDNAYRMRQWDFKFFLGFEQNVRREYNHPADPLLPGEYIVLKTLDYGLGLNLPTIKGVDISAGVNGMVQHNRNHQATDFPIPDYNVFDLGSYVFGKWRSGKWTVSGGLRYDVRSETGFPMWVGADPQSGFFSRVDADYQGAAQQKFSGFNLHFLGTTGSCGFTYRINDNLSVKANVAKGYRAPNITEIAANGLDPGAHIVYIGNLGFSPEFSLQEDAGFTGSWPGISFGCSFFNNNINNYIYEDQAVDKNGNPLVVIAGNKTFQFQQTNAWLYGANVVLSIHPSIHTKWRWDHVLSSVYSFNLNPRYAHAGTMGEYLPFTPPPRWISKIQYRLVGNTKGIGSVSFAAESEYNFAQNRYMALFNTEAATPAFLLFGLSVHADIRYQKKGTFQMQLQVNNLMNTAYQNHLSRLQYFEYYTNAPDGRKGIYNMGRNFCIKLIFPF